MQSSIFPDFYPVKKPISSASLDKLVQLPTKELVIPSDGTNIKRSRKSLSTRASRKYHTNEILAPLLYYAKEINSPLHNHYQKAFYCNSTLTQINGKLTGKYCNSRVCHTCNRIRTAKQINGYESIMAKSIAEGNKIAFATLTIPNVNEPELKDTTRLMKKQLSLIQRVLKEKRGITAKGIIKLEITWSDKRKDFHPHFHILSDSFEYNQMLIEEWLKRFPGATIKAQDNKYADMDSSLKELFKYSTKIIDTDNSKLKDKTNRIAHVNLYALDVIMNALYKQRTIIAFGMTQLSEEVDNLISQEYSDLPPTQGNLIEVTYYDYENHCYKKAMRYEWIRSIEWIWNSNDWYFEGMALSDYVPKSKDKFSFHFHYK
jgi:hypothetical protein